MLTRCTGLTLSGSKCKRSAKCQWHKPKDNCAICMEEVGVRYPTTCPHVFHENCLVNWYVHSDVCPVCRSVQDTDKFILFKKSLDDVIREKYRDAIHTLEYENERLENENERLRRRVRV